MDIQRFEQLSEAFGGDVRRWPQAEREQAQAVMTARPAATAALLGAAGGLDAALGASRPPVVSAALREAILMSAPKPRAGFAFAAAWLRPLLPSAGFAAGAVVAGILVGAVLARAVVADTRGEAMIAAAAEDVPTTITATWLEGSI